MHRAWSQVIDFIVRKDATIASSFVGVAQSEIDAVQARYRITLPRIYVEFLRSMGESSGALQAFGTTYVHAFSALLAQLPAEDYPGERFFRVAFVAEQYATDPIDTYLDLARSDGNDAPLVDFETPFSPEDTRFSEDHLSFAERLHYRIFRELDIDRRRCGADVVVFRDAEAKDAGLDILTRFGFATALPDLRRVACLSRESVGVLISVSDAGALTKFEIGGDSESPIDDVLRQLRGAFPDGRQTRR
jgi:hypothetical protein